MYVTLASLSFVSLVAAALPDGVIELPLRRIKNQTAYGVELQVGNPPQNVVVLADTGSETYGVVSTANSACQQGFCSEYGAYDNTTSTTTKWISGGYNDAVADHAIGSFVNDTLRVGGVTLEDMTFGFIENYTASFAVKTQQSAIFGLGVYCNTKACNGYPSFIHQLYEKGVISRRAISVFLGRNDEDAKGSLLIGGIDLAKRKGPVYKLNVQDPTNNDANSQPNFVSLSGFELQLSNGTKFASNYDNGTYALWDTGASEWYFPQDMLDALISYWGVRNYDPNAPLVVDCKFREPSNDSIAVHIAPGVTIDVPVSSLLDDNGGGVCTAAIGAPGPLLGDAFLRNVYFTFDYDNLTVEFSLARYTDETNIIKIE